MKILRKLKAGKHVTVVSLGDSNTETTFHTRGRLNWAGLLAEAIFETYGNGVCTMINSGKCASTCQESLTRLKRDVLQFEPDLVIIYCNSAQLRCLLTGIKYKEGYQVTSTLEPGGACVQSTVPVIQSGECQVTVPCAGDYRWALARDDEIIFSLPKDKMEDLMSGLRHFDEIGRGYTDIVHKQRPEYPLAELYVKLGRMVGMDVHQ